MKRQQRMRMNLPRKRRKRKGERQITFGRYSTKDPLTGAMNREAFHDFLPLHTNKRIYGGQQVTVCFMDLDGLKGINDTHGHLAGDRALSLMATLVKEEIRSQDMFFRYGGDEFLLFFTGMGREEAFKIWQRVIRRINLYNQQPEEWGKFSVSVGFATGLVEEPPCLWQLIHQADREMYRQKRAGKSVCEPTE
ncbi:GGDEF domain-containing protein [Anoxynatronum sibiricum]|uniref:GGDEF domain-containing protein n=1 Tax=Anoxynatronum sibiricum TaxID=210623 RepID=A0ABU9VSZ5_9CLOT